MQPEVRPGLSGEQLLGDGLPRQVRDVGRKRQGTDRGERKGRKRKGIYPRGHGSWTAADAGQKGTVASDRTNATRVAC